MRGRYQLERRRRGMLSCEREGIEALVKVGIRVCSKIMINSLR